LHFFCSQFTFIQLAVPIINPTIHSALCVHETGKSFDCLGAEPFKNLFSELKLYQAMFLFVAYLTWLNCRASNFWMIGNSGMETILGSGVVQYRGVDKSLARPTSRYILFDGKNISFDTSLFIHINSTNISPIMIIRR